MFFQGTSSTVERLAVLYFTSVPYHEVAMLGLDDSTNRESK